MNFTDTTESASTEKGLIPVQPDIVPSWITTVTEYPLPTVTSVWEGDM